MYRLWQAIQFIVKINTLCGSCDNKWSWFQQRSGLTTFLTTYANTYLLCLSTSLPILLLRLITWYLSYLSVTKPLNIKLPSLTYNVLSSLSDSSSILTLYVHSIHGFPLLCNHNICMFYPPLNPKVPRPRSTILQHSLLSKYNLSRIPSLL